MIAHIYYCSFCRKHQDHPSVSVMVAGPGGINICDECVALCVNNIAEHKTKLEKEQPPGGEG